MYKRALKTVKMYNNEHDSKRNNILTSYDYCPWCGEKTNLRIGERRGMYNSYTNVNRIPQDAKVYYECFCCGARSPFVYITTEMLDEEKVLQQLENIVVENMEAKDEEEENER